VCNSGELKKEDIKYVVKLIWGVSNYKANENLHRSLDNLKPDTVGGFFSKKGFIDAVKENAMVLSPFLLFVEKLKGLFGGEHFWMRMITERENAFGMNSSIFDILGYEIHEKKEVKVNFLSFLCGKVEGIPPQLSKMLTQAISDIADTRARNTPKKEESEAIEEKKKRQIHAERMKNKEASKKGGMGGLARRLSTGISRRLSGMVRLIL